MSNISNMNVAAGSQDGLLSMLGESKGSDKAVDKGFSSVFRSVMADSNIGGKKAIKSDAGPIIARDVSSNITKSQKPDFLIINNNIVKPSINDESSDDETKKEVMWLMSALISRFVTEADIKKLIPEGAGEGLKDMSSIMGELETLIESKIMAGEISVEGSDSLENNPATMLKDLQAYLAKYNVAQGDKAISAEDFQNILSTARNMGIKSGEDTNISLTSNPLDAEAEATSLSPLQVDNKIAEANSGKANISQTLHSFNKEDIAAVQRAVATDTSTKTAVTENKTANMLGIPVEEEGADLLVNDKANVSVKDKEALATNNAPVKDGVVKNAAELLMAEKNSSPRINPEIAGETVNKNFRGDEKLEVRPSLRNETAANLEVFKVKIGDNSNGTAFSNSNSQQRGDALNLANAKIVSAAAENINKEEAANNFQTYIKEEMAGGKETQATSVTKDIPQSYDMRDVKDISRFMKTLEMMASAKGESRLSVTLTPEHLGRLEIRLVENGGKLTAKFFTDNETSHKMMLAHGDAIRSQLLEKGIVIENMDFAFKDATAGKEGGEGKRSSSSKDGKKGYKDNDSEDDTSSLSVTEHNSHNNAVYA